MYASLVSSMALVNTSNGKMLNGSSSWMASSSIPNRKIARIAVVGIVSQ